MQMAQIAYWLDFLNSTLSLPTQCTSNTHSKWCIMIVGLRSDLQQESSSSIQAKNLASWRSKYPRLAIMDTPFRVSSKTSLETVQQFCNALERECNRIFNKHSIRIPKSYRSTLLNLESCHSSQVLVPWETLYEQQQQATATIDRPTFYSALQYLHAIGRIVLLKSGMVCINPSVVPQIAAKFISPEEVRLDLLLNETENVQILTKHNIGCLLQIQTTNNNRLYSLVIFSNILMFYS